VIDPDKVAIANRIIVKAECVCGYRIRVKVVDKGAHLDKWEVACQNHRKLKVKVVLGYVYATGKPTPDQAAELIQRSIRGRVALVRTTDHEPFVVKVRF
jgi:hypothetical protein